MGWTDVFAAFAVLNSLYSPRCFAEAIIRPSLEKRLPVLLAMLGA